MELVHRIAVDLDDVLFDFAGYFFRWHNEQYGTALRPEQITHERIWEVWGGTVEEASERIPRFFREIDMLGMAPMDGAVTTLEGLRAHSRLAVVSARDPSTSDVTRTWIDKYLPGVFDEVVLGIGNPLAGPKRAGGRPLNKAEVCQALGAELLIEDQLAHGLKAAAAGIGVLLFGNRPWNQADPLPQGMERVRDWAHVSRVLGYRD